MKLFKNICKLRSEKRLGIDEQIYIFWLNVSMTKIKKQYLKDYTRLRKICGRIVDYDTYIIISMTPMYILKSEISACVFRIPWFFCRHDVYYIFLELFIHTILLRMFARGSGCAHIKKNLVSFSSGSTRTSNNPSFVGQNMYRREYIRGYFYSERWKRNNLIRRRSEQLFVYLIWSFFLVDDF